MPGTGRVPRGLLRRYDPNVSPLLPPEGPRLPERRGFALEWRAGGAAPRFAFSSRRSGLAALPGLVVGGIALTVFAAIALAFLVVFSVIGLFAVLVFGFVLRRKLAVALRPPVAERRVRLPFRVTRRRRG